MTRTPRQEAILTDLAEVLDVDEDLLTTPTKSFTPLVDPDPDKGFVPPLTDEGDSLEGKEVQIVNTNNIFWVFPSLEAVETVNQMFARWLIDHGKIQIPDRAYLAVIDPSLVQKYVRSVVYDSEEVEKQAYRGDSKAFWNIAEQFGIHPESQEIEMEHPYDKTVKKLRNEYAKYRAQHPIEYLIDQVGEKEAVKLLINGVGLTEEGTAQLTEQLVESKEFLRPLNVGTEVGHTRYGLVFVQVSGKPVKIFDISDIPTGI